MFRCILAYRILLSSLKYFFAYSRLFFFLVGCRSDSECPLTHACINRECIDPCSYTLCGLNALCRVEGNHRPRCYCLDTFSGDPLVSCMRPMCTKDDDCPYNLMCSGGKCVDPCKCGIGAICTVRNHRDSCSCPPRYFGNPLILCKLG